MIEADRDRLNDKVIGLEEEREQIKEQNRQ
jgi:hypothetical protein